MRQKAADAGYADAQLELGYFYAYGYGVEQSYDKALEYYTLASEQGNTIAMTNIGLMYEYGNGGIKTRSARWSITRRRRTWAMRARR